MTAPHLLFSLFSIYVLMYSVTFTRSSLFSLSNHSLFTFFLLTSFLESKMCSLDSVDNDDNNVMVDDDDD